MDYVLLQNQLGIFAAEQLAQDGSDYNLETVFLLNEKVDIERLRKAVDAAVAAHPYIKCRLCHTIAQDVRIEEHAEDSFKTVISESNDIEKVRKHLNRRFDFFNERLFRIEICKTPNGNYLCLNFSHLIFDGWSYMVFLGEISRAYNGETLIGEKTELFTLHQREEELRRGKQYEEEKNWYLKEFEPFIETDSMPLPDLSEETVHYETFEVSLDADLERINALSEKTGTSRGTVFTAAFALTLGAFSGDARTFFTTIYHGRDEALKNSLGMLVRTLPVAVDTTDAKLVSELLGTLRKQNLKTRESKAYSFADLSRELGVKSNILFAYQEDFHNYELKTGDDYSTLILRENKIPGVDFCVQIFKQEKGYQVSCIYPAHSFSRELIEGFFKSYQNILSELTEKTLLKDIEISDRGQLDKLDLLTTASFDESIAKKSVTASFRECVVAYPNVDAVVFKDRHYTFGELNEVTDKLAEVILDKVNKDLKSKHIDKAAMKMVPVVSILIPRNEYMVIAPLAAMKAGCAYQPLDPAYPKERLNFMVRDASASLVIEAPEFCSLLDEYEGERLSTADFDSIFKGEETGLRLPGAAPEDAMVLLYTSGTTGVPKGVILEQRNLMTWCSWFENFFDYQPGDSQACYASFGFDAHMVDIYTALTAGRTVHIIPEEIRLDLIALNKYLEANNIKGVLITTAVATQFATNIRHSSLKYLMTGGESLASIEPPADYELVNAYGPTETAISVTAKRVHAKEKNIPIGKSNETAKLYVVDRYMHRLPVGAPGELIIAGPQVGPGYLDRPDKTAEVYIDNPFADESDPFFERAYRTGDIVRYRENGDIEFVGRRDHQVKIHGYRIELKEVESVIREYEGITDATVQALDDPNGGKFIAAYICADETIDTKELDSFIAARKPSYMVPRVTIQLDRIPYNVNQKVDKKALPYPEPKKNRAAGESKKDKAAGAPLNLLEQKLKDTLSTILGTDDFDICDELSVLGLSSISSIKLAVTLLNDYGIEFNAFELLDNGTLLSIENRILDNWLKSEGKLTNLTGDSNTSTCKHDSCLNPEDKNEKSDEQSDANTDEPNSAGVCMSDDKEIAKEDCINAAKIGTNKSDKKLSAPLSFAEQGVYAECLANPDSTFYNIAECILMPEGITEDEIRDALEKLFRAHPILSSCFRADDTESIVKTQIPDFALSVPVKSMRLDEFEEYKKSFVKPMSLEKGPLACFEIVKADSIYLLMNLHHLIADGASVDILLNDLCKALDGKKPEEERITSYDFALEQHVDQENEAFFDTLMSDVDEASRLIPDIYEQDAVHTEGIVSVKTDLLPVLNYSKGKGITAAAVYLAATLLTVGRYTYEDNVAIATISSGRSDIRLTNTVGMFVNTLPVAAKLDNRETTADYINRISELFSGIIRHERHPFALVSAKYDFKPQISYAYQVGVLSQYMTEKGKLKTEELSNDEAKIPISVQIFGDEKNGGTIQINYDTGLYSEAFALGFAKSLKQVVSLLVHTDTVSAISLTDESDHIKLDGFNRSMQLDYDLTDSVVSRFREVAASYPEKEAACYRDKSYTYRELDELTDRLSACIRKKLKASSGEISLAETVISVIISRSEYVFLLPLAILKTGCAYEPLDPSYPTERLNFMVSDAGARLLISEDGLEGLVGDYQGEVLRISELEQMETELKQYELCEDPKPEDLMIMLYTSGSTGTPKGCQIEHGNMVAFAYGSNCDGFYTTDGRTASYASFGFDVCMSDIFCTLLNGATLCVIPEDIRMNLDMLADYFNKAGITQVLLTTQVGVQFVLNYPKMDTLRFLVMGGEKLPALDPDRLNYTIINGYGPTENCCGVSLFPIHHWESNIPIGKPLVTIAGYVLDKTGHRLPTGAAGEYCVSGPQVTRGYLNRPDKTAEAYCKSPFNSFRMYHTGDIVRYRENGDVEFVGRKDGQVKIRGFRVETKEVEAVIRDYPGITDATVQAFSYDNGGKFLAAYVVSSDTVDIDGLNRFIKERKPAYMVPLATIQIDRIPLTINQKVDKKALPKPEVKRAEYEAPASKEESDFCKFFEKVLGVDKVGAGDDFFELGGSSISAMRIVVAANRAGYDIVYQNIFDCPTPHELAAFVRNADSDAAAQHEDKPAETAPASFDNSCYGFGTREVGPDGYDYHAINKLLRKNDTNAFLEGTKQSLGSCLLLGATGYLGAHVLRELINKSDSTIFCLIRAKKGESATERLISILRYYFADCSKDYESLIGTRIRILEGDATDREVLNGISIDAGEITVINCAASVKHFARGNEIELTNVETVRNLTEWCLEHNARLVHISTESIFGHPLDGVPREDFKYDEHMLYVGQVYEDNQYVRSKFLAERLIYESVINKGLNAKVLRAGNLAPRSYDGHFQINAESNNYLSTLKGFKALGMVPYSASVAATEFSPIDKVAEAVVLLAGTPRECICFMMSNNHRPLMEDVIDCMNENGSSIRYVDEKEFIAAVGEALMNPDKCDLMRPFMAYSLNGAKGSASLSLEALNVSYTSEILKRMGFSWPVCGSTYCKQFISALDGLKS